MASQPSRLKSVLRLSFDLTMAGGLIGALFLVYRYEASGTRVPELADARESADSPNFKDEAKPVRAVGADGQSGSPKTVVAGSRVRPRSETDVSTPSVAPPIVETRLVTDYVETTKSLRIAISKPRFDDIGQLLTRMGQGYKDFDELDWTDLQNPAKLETYDILFLTCAEPRLLPISTAVVLRNFVTSGKTLYVSDLWFRLVREAFPEAGGEIVDESGKKQEIVAKVLDQSLQQAVGQRLDLSFDVDGWVPARFYGSNVLPLIRGEFTITSGASREAPLLVKFPAGQGTVIFTSFHNSKQASESELKLLKALVVIVATARVERQLRETAFRGGLSPQHGSLLTASRGGEPVREVYQNRRRGRLKFILGFEKIGGAHLKLSVKGPEGRVLEKDGTTGVEIEVADAAEGEWSYSISVISVPYDNFGYQLLIAE